MVLADNSDRNIEGSKPKKYSVCVCVCVCVYVRLSGTPKPREAEQQQVQYLSTVRQLFKKLKRCLSVTSSKWTH